MKDKITPKNTTFACFTVQFITVAVVVLSVFCLKTFYKDGYKTLKTFYNQNIKEGTNLNEFFESFEK